MTIMNIHMGYSKCDFKDLIEDYVYLTKKGLSKYNHFMGGEQY